MTFVEFRSLYLSSTRIRLRQKAIQMALKGDRTMLIFSLKNLCDWKDHPKTASEEADTSVTFDYGNGEFSRISEEGVERIWIHRFKNKDQPEPS